MDTNDNKYQKFKDKLRKIEELIEYLENHKIVTNENDLLLKLGTTVINDGITLYDLLKRPEITINKLIEIGKVPNNYSEEVIEQVEITIKYSGYILKEEKEIAKMQEIENVKIPENIDYDKVINIASEAKDKLKKVMPISLGQASRISGVNPSDIAMLSVYLKKEKNHG